MRKELLAAVRSLTAATLLAVMGCGGGGDLAPVSGVVLLDGEPVESGTVYFIPDSGAGSEGELAAGGRFTLTTQEGRAGAILGRHRVAVAAFKEAVWPPNYDQADNGQDSGILVPARYGTADSSGLEYDVQPGENEFTIELSSR